MLVKSMLVPLVDATAVPLVKTPVPVGVPLNTGLANPADVRFGESPLIVIAIIKPLK
jgi:hypothetical protein